MREAVAEAAVEDHPVQVAAAENLPYVSIDARLMVQALAAILRNAANYSPPQQQIEATARAAEQTIRRASRPAICLKLTS